MGLLINTVPSSYTPEEAERVAAALQSGDDEWIYRAEHAADQKGLSRVEVLDETGEHIRYW